MLAQVGKFFSSFSTPDQMADDPYKIIHIKQGNLPRYRFEYHPRAKRVYVIDIYVGAKTGKPVGNLIAYHIETEAHANNAVLTWCRGYFVGKEDRSHNDQGKIVLIGEHS